MINGWTVTRSSHERGFNSTAARLGEGGGLQPTSGEEATQRAIWQY